MDDRGPIVLRMLEEKFMWRYPKRKESELGLCNATCFTLDLKGRSLQPVCDSASFLYFHFLNKIEQVGKSIMF